MVEVQSVKLPLEAITGFEPRILCNRKTANALPHWFTGYILPKI